MKDTRHFPRVFSLILSLLLCLSVLPGTAFAANSNNKKGGLTAFYLPDEKAKEGVTFSLYKVADYADGSLFQMTRTFSRYSVTIPDMEDNIAVTAFNTTLAAYIARDKVRADATQKTDRRGRLSFSNLDLGMYLVIGESYKDEDSTAVYTPVPFLVFFPYFDDSVRGGATGYQANDLEIKYDKTDGERADLHILKSWRNENNSTQRPTTIAVDLIKDGELFDTIVLSADNNWRHTLYDLEADHRWQLVENTVPTGYTTAINREGSAYVITNTYGGGRNPVTDPENPGTTIIDRPPALSEMPDVPVDDGVDIKPDPIVDIPDGNIPLGDIPQTGQLWWPVPLFLLAGVACVVCGVTAQYKKRKENS